MKIALFGYGKMGQIIERLAVEAGDEIVLKVDGVDHVELKRDRLEQADVAIDFSQPDAAVPNIYLALDAGVPVVMGTTGWLDRLPEVSCRVKSERGALFWASNFSIGVHIFFATARELSRFIEAEPYQVSIEETHHTEKLDAPSGTALTLSEIVELELGEAIQITSHREPDVPGTHRLKFSSPTDTLELVHTAHSREGFARGALAAARWIIGRKGVYTMSDLLDDE